MSTFLQLASVLVGSVFVVAGLAFTVRRAMPYRHRPVDALEATTEPGPVAVQGTARSAGVTTAAPYTGRDCLCCEYEAQRARFAGRRRTWKTERSGLEGGAFYVEDDTGSVLVNPAGTDCRLTRDYVGDADGTEATGDGLTGPSVGETRYVESRLDPGETVYVHGQVRHPGESDLGEAVVGDGPAVSRPVVVEGGRWRGVRRETTRLLAVVVIGGLLLAYGLPALP